MVWSLERDVTIKSRLSKSCEMGCLQLTQMEWNEFGKTFASIASIFGCIKYWVFLALQWIRVSWCLVFGRASNVDKLERIDGFSTRNAEVWLLVKKQKDSRFCGQSSCDALSEQHGWNSGKPFYNSRSSLVDLFGTRDVCVRISVYPIRGELDSGLLKSRGGHPRLDFRNARMESNMQQMGNPNSGQIRKLKQPKSSKIQLSSTMPRSRRMGRIQSRLVTRNELRLSSMGIVAKSRAAHNRAKSQNSIDSTSLERTTMVSRYSTILPGLFFNRREEFQTRAIDTRRTLEKHRMEVQGNADRVSLKKLQQASDWLVSQSREESTQHVYCVYQRRYMEFVDFHRLDKFSQKTVILFLTKWFCRNLSYSGTRQAWYSIRAMLVDERGEQNWDPKLYSLLKACARLGKVPNRRRRSPFPVELLSLLVKKRLFNWTVWEWLRNCSMIALGLRTMARASELCRLQRENVVEKDDGSLLIKFERTKTKKQGRTVLIRPSGRPTCPVRLLTAWLKFNDTQLLFPLNSSNVPLVSEDVSHMLQVVGGYFKSSGFFSSHSLRIGGASALAFAGYSKEQIQAIGDWSSDAIDKYFRESLDHRLNVTTDMLL